MHDSTGAPLESPLCPLSARIGELTLTFRVVDGEPVGAKFPTELDDVTIDDPSELPVRFLVVSLPALASQVPR